MKRLFLAANILMMVLILAACGNKTNSSKQLDKEGIAPYELSKSENYILQSFGMAGNSQIISFKAPKEAISFPSSSKGQK